MSVENKDEEPIFDSATRDVLISAAKLFGTTGQDTLMSCHVGYLRGRGGVKVVSAVSGFLSSELLPTTDVSPPRRRFVDALPSNITVAVLTT